MSTICFVPSAPLAQAALQGPAQRLRRRVLSSKNPSFHSTTPAYVAMALSPSSGNENHSGNFSASSDGVQSTPRDSERLRTVPALLTGHGAVLGVALAVAALLLDVMRNLVAVVVASRQQNKSPVRSSEIPLVSLAALSVATLDPSDNIQPTDPARENPLQIHPSNSIAQITAPGTTAELARAQQRLAEAEQAVRQVAADVVANLDDGHPVDPINADLDFPAVILRLHNARIQAEARANEAELALAHSREQLNLEVAQRLEAENKQAALARDALDLDTQLSETTAAVNQLRQRVIDIEKARNDDSSGAVTTMRELQANLEQANAQLAAAQAESTRLDKEREGLQALAHQYAEQTQRKARELEQLHQQLELKQAEQLEAERAQQEATNAVQDRLAAAKSELAALRLEAKNRNHEASVTADKLRSTLGAREVELNLLVSQLNAARQQLEIVEAREKNMKANPDFNDDILVVEPCDPAWSEERDFSDEASLEGDMVDLSASEPEEQQAPRSVKPMNNDNAGLERAEDLVPAAEAGSLPGDERTVPADADSSTAVKEPDVVEVELAVARQTAAKLRPEDRETPPLPKTRRGRPRSRPTSSDTNDSASSSTPPIKRGRGRPRKNPLPPSDDDSSKHSRNHRSDKPSL